MHHCITLSVDYHDENSVIRKRDSRTGAEHVFTIPTTAAAINRVVEQAQAELGRRGGRIVWVQESTSGWARVQELLGDRVEFILANVVQMPRPPKGHRRKTDRTDTARLQREYLNGQLPRAHQPPASWRQLRRLVARRENIVNRRTALRNWIGRYLAHETWESRAGLWSGKGQRRLRKLAQTAPGWDGGILKQKLDELEWLGTQLSQGEAWIHEAYRQLPDAQRLDAMRGIGVVAAVSIVARIGPIERFRDAEQLIAYAGLAPGIHESNQKRHDGRIGGGGTDAHLRHYLIEATVWARTLPRYQPTYERAAKRRGAKIGRLVVARLMLRSIYKVLRDGINFTEQGPAAERLAAKV